MRRDRPFRLSHFAKLLLARAAISRRWRGTFT
jgi:hypothetical protein